MSSSPTVRRLAVAVLLALIGAACGSDVSRSDVVGDFTEMAGVPTYERLASGTADLDEAVTSLCESPDATAVDAARDAMAQSRRDWKSAEAMWLGPVTDRRSWSVIDWPIEPDEIEELIENPDIEMTADVLGTSIGADQRGLGAVEYVLGEDDEATLTSLGEGRRCDYLVGIADVIAAQADLLVEDWTVTFEDGPGFVEGATEDPDATVDTIVSDAIFLLTAMTDMELDVALGANGEPDPEAILEGPAGLGVADLRARLVGLRATLVGGDGIGEGLSPLLDDDLVGRLRDGFDATDAAAADLDGPLLAAIESNPDAVAEVAASLDELEVMVSTEIVSALGVTVGFSDADGDSAG